MFYFGVVLIVIGSTLAHRHFEDRRIHYLLEKEGVTTLADIGASYEELESSVKQTIPRTVTLTPLSWIDLNGDRVVKVFKEDPSAFPTHSVINSISKVEIIYAPSDPVTTATVLHKPEPERRNDLRASLVLCLLGACLLIPAFKKWIKARQKRIS